MRFWRHLLLISLALPIVGGEAPSLSDKELRDAKKLYVLKCAKCHKFYEPTGYSAEDWEMWMVKMIKKSHLKDKQARLVTEYAELIRRGEVSSPAVDRKKPKR
jgi:hypothetical protein